MLLDKMPWGKIKRLLIVISALIIGCYFVVGFTYLFSKRDFCGQLNRFVITDGNEVISIVVDGKARGYKVENTVHPPFVFSLRAQRRREQLIQGRHYDFTSVGFRFMGAKPILTREKPRKDNQPCQ